MPDQGPSTCSLIGLEFSHYRIIEEIGSGGMGVVFRARDQHLDREVAIKVLHPRTITDEWARKHLHKEAQALSKLNHPNIATIHDFDAWQGMDFMVMEYIPGVTLNDKLAGGPLSENEALRLGIQLSEGLAAAHERGIVHRDLKPGNLRLTSDGRLKILDFGLAILRQPSTKSAAAETTLQTQAISGTFAYMAPEQLMGEELDARTDIHGAGLVLYEMTTGQRPFAEVQSNQLIGAILRRSPSTPRTLNSKISLELERIIVKCLEKEPTNRYQSAKELAADLQRLQHGAESSRTVVAAAKPELKLAPQLTRFRWAAVTGATLLVIGLAVGGWLFSSRNPHALTNKDTIVVSDFENKTGDPVFDDALKQGLSIQLEQSPFLDLISERRVSETLKLMSRPVGDRLTPVVTREVCQRTASKAMLAGSIVALGSQYVIGLKAVDCNTGDVLAEVQQRAARKEAVLKAMDIAAISLRSKLGESLSSVQKYATPVEEATTPSLEALKAYGLGQQARLAKGDTAALPFYKRAVELDPNFAMAYRAMASVYGSRNEVGRAAKNARDAYELRQRVSERERFFIEASYYMYVTGELENATQTYELWQQTYPRDDVPYGNLGYISGSLGNWERALIETQEAMRLDPSWYDNLAAYYMALNQLDDAEALFRPTGERKQEHRNLLAIRYTLAFLKRDSGQMAQFVADAMGKPGTEDELLSMQSDTEAWYGKLKNARELTQRATDSAQRNDAKETAAAYMVAAALREVASENRKQALARAKAALILAPNRDVQAMAALALARAGDTAAARKLAAKIDKTFPLDTMIQSYWLPTIRAAVALGRKDPNRAVEQLKITSAIELGQPTYLTVLLCPVYLRGEAYLMLHDGNRASAEFQKFIDHRGVVANFPWGALARLGLARAYAMQGNTVKARAAYQDFLMLWKDADPDIPILVAAKSEYAKLK